MIGKREQLAAGRAFLERWRRYLEQHPDADPTAVNRAMLAGEPPPDADRQEEARARRKQEAEARRVAAIEERTNVVSGLSKMQREWLVRYLLHGNATRAAEETGYAQPHSQGPRLRKHPTILAAIDEFFHEEEMSARETIARLSQQARAEYAEYIRVVPDHNGHVVDIVVDLEAMLADGKGHLIKSTKYARDGRLMIEFYDAHQALVDIGRYHGLFSDKLDANIATNDSGMTVDEWREEAAKRRQEAAQTMATFESEEEE